MPQVEPKKDKKKKKKKKVLWWRESGQSRKEENVIKNVQVDFSTRSPFPWEHCFSGTWLWAPAKLVPRSSPSSPPTMIIYQDLISHGEMFSNIYKIQKIRDELEVEGKMVSRTEGDTDDLLIGGSVQMSKVPKSQQSLVSILSWTITCWKPASQKKPTGITSKGVPIVALPWAVV